MSYSHYGKIIETYQKMLALSAEPEKPNKEILDIVLDAYEAAYEAGCGEERDRVHFFHLHMIDQEALLENCHK